MNGRASSSPLSSSVARISSSQRTSTSSRARRSSLAPGADARICTTVLATARTRPAQLIVEASRALEALDLGQPHVAATEEFVGRHLVALVRLVELLHALANRPPRPELGQDPLDLREVDTVVTRVGAGPGRVLDPAAGDHRLDHVGHFANPEVLVAEPDVEGLVVGAHAVDAEYGHEGSADVLDVDKWAPRRSVAL